MQEYKIGEKIYIQRPLVLGQIQQVFSLFKDANFPSEFTTNDMIVLLGDRLAEFLAIVLTEKGKSLKGKNLKEIAEEIAFSIDLDMTVEVIDYFFELNSIESILKKFAGIFIKGIEKMKLTTGSMNSSSSSQEETSPKESKSSGDIPQGSADPISNSN